MARVSFRYTAEAVEFYRDDTLAFALSVEDAVKLAKEIITEFLLRSGKKVKND